jgi:DNA-directed RNA polymerase subunit RPC12/RpoP
MSLMDKVKELLVPDEEETVLYDYECQDCDKTITSSDEPEEATCKNCGSSDLKEVGKMYAGGGGGGGAG